jgi:hypothetical protein
MVSLTIASASHQLRGWRDGRQAVHECSTSANPPPRAPRPVQHQIAEREIEERPPEQVVVVARRKNQRFEQSPLRLVERARLFNATPTSAGHRRLIEWLAGSKGLNSRSP